MRVAQSVPAKENHETVRRLYRSLQARDWRAMADCYTPDAKFEDPVFRNLSGPDVAAMWRMLCLGAKDLQVSLEDARIGDYAGTAKWEARYTFSKTGRPVVNRGRATFTFQGAKIVSHHDRFPFWKWSRQALGAPGLALGWTPLVKRRVRREARASLEKAKNLA